VQAERRSDEGVDVRLRLLILAAWQKGPSGITPSDPFRCDETKTRALPAGQGVVGLLSSRSGPGTSRQAPYGGYRVTPTVARACLASAMSQLYRSGPLLERNQ
jgi:hypothetical protein